MSKDNLYIEVMVKHRISTEQLRDLLSCALEGGINYWADYKAGYSPTEEELAQGPGGIWEGLPQYWVEHPDYKLIIRDIAEGKDLELTYSGLKLGIVDLAKKYPHHVYSITNDEMDAETGDAFIQCCVLGDIYYG